jgi:hypothetical protein
MLSVLLAFTFTLSIAWAQTLSAVLVALKNAGCTTSSCTQDVALCNGNLGSIRTDFGRVSCTASGNINGEHGLSVLNAQCVGFAHARLGQKFLSTVAWLRSIDRWELLAARS